MLTKMSLKWCPAPEPPPYTKLRQHTKPIIVFATTAVLILSILATSFSALSAPAAIAPVADQIQKSLTSSPASATVEPTATPNPTLPPTSTSNSAPAQGSTTSTTTQSPPPTCIVSGYVLDSNGNGLAGADVIFNQPYVMPGVITNSSGYYQTSGPAGTYHMSVWPPFDSSYINYDQAGVVISSDRIINVTLTTGYKVSGYITDSSGAPVKGGVVVLGNYLSGYFSTASGYYFLAVPAGTYTINAHPGVNANNVAVTAFNTYIENNFVVSDSTTKNITVTGTNPTPDPTIKYKISGYVTDSSGRGIANANVIFNVPSIVPSVFTNSQGYFEAFAPVGTYRIDVWPPFDSSYLSYTQQALNVTGAVTSNFTLTQGCKVSGYITDSSGNPISGALALLDNHLSGWFSKSDGYYFVTAPPGTYTLTIRPQTGATFTTYTISNFVVNGTVTQNIVVQR